MSMKTDEEQNLGKQRANSIQEANQTSKEMMSIRNTYERRMIMLMRKDETYEEEEKIV